MVNPATITIRITREIKKCMDNKKIHPRETYNDVIKRLVNNEI